MTSYASDLDRQAAQKRAELADLERRAAYARGAPTSTEMRDSREAQARFDAVYVGAGFGGAPPPLVNEPLHAYRARLVEGLKNFVKPESRPLVEDMRKLAMNPATATAHEHFEERLLGEARATIADKTIGDFRDPSQLRRIEKVSENGTRVIEWAGSPRSWMERFSHPQRLATRLGLPGQRQWR
jgi:hypothetical protein